MAYSYSAFLLRRHAASLRDITRDAVEDGHPAEVRRRVSAALAPLSWSDGDVIDILWGDGSVTLRIAGVVLGIESHSNDVRGLAERLATVGFGVFDAQTGEVIAQPHRPPRE